METVGACHTWRKQKINSEQVQDIYENRIKVPTTSEFLDQKWNKISFSLIKSNLVGLNWNISFRNGSTRHLTHSRYCFTNPLLVKNVRSITRIVLLSYFFVDDETQPGPFAVLQWLSYSEFFVNTCWACFNSREKNSYFYFFLSNKKWSRAQSASIVKPSFEQHCSSLKKQVEQKNGITFSYWAKHPRQNRHRGEK